MTTFVYVFDNEDDLRADGASEEYLAARAAYAKQLRSRWFGLQSMLMDRGGYATVGTKNRSLVGTALSPQAIAQLALPA